MAEKASGATQAPQKSLRPPYEPSDFLVSYQDQPFVKYTNYPVDFYNSLKSTDFTGASQFKGKMPLKSLTALVNEFNALDLKQLISEPTPMIKEFIEYARNQFEPDSYKYIVNFFHPLIVPDNTKKFVLFMVKIIHLVKEPNKVLTWFTKCVLPPIFTRQTKQNIVAISRCKQGKKQNFWAVLDSDNMFYFYEFKGTDFVEKTKGKVALISQGKDKLSVDITSGTKVI